MEISTKELRANPGRTMRRVSAGREIVVTYRGKAVAKIVPLDSAEGSDVEEADELFGMWADAEIDDVDAQVREMRRGRTF